MTAFTATAPRFEIGGVLSATFGIVGRNLPLLLVFGAVIGIVPSLALGLARLQVSSMLGFAPTNFFVLEAFAILASLAFAVLQAGVVYIAGRDLSGKRAGFGDTLAAVLRNLVPAVLTGLLVGVGTMAGMVLLLIPGIILAMAWSVAVPALVVEKKGVIAAIKRSAELTRDRRWFIFGLFFVCGLLLWVVKAPVMFALGGFSIANQGTPTFIIATSVMSGLGAVVTNTMAAVLFFDLRRAREGVGVDGVAATFD